MTKEEKRIWESQMDEAYTKYREVEEKITELENSLEILLRERKRWRSAYEEADRAIALEERLTRVPPGVSGKRKREKSLAEAFASLTETQIKDIIKVLDKRP